MRRLLLSFILMLGLASAAMAQTDTIFNRCDHYYYTGWYDTVQHARGVDCGFKMDYYCPSKDMYGGMYALFRQDYPSEKIAIKGLAVNVMRSIMDFNPPLIGYFGADDSTKLPEYALLAQLTDSGFVYLDSARWDTMQPKLMQLPQTCTNLDSVAYCYSYEVLFKSPILVEDSFLVGSTANSNFISPQTNHFTHVPTVFTPVMHFPNCGNRQFLFSTTPFYGYYRGDPDLDIIYCEGPWRWGAFFAIVDFYDIEILSADSVMGTVEGGGRFSDLTDHILTAIPNEGFCFSHWSDGSTDNPRVLAVSQDSSLTTFFTEVSPATVSVFADNDAYGHVEGGGEYMTCDEVTITAIPNEDCRFYSWSDGNTDNPRTFTLRGDTSFTAIFEIRVDIDEADASPAFALSPNPAHEAVTVTLSEAPTHTTLVLRDAVGKEHLRLTPSSPKTDISLRGLPAGTYLLTLTTSQGSSTQKLVIE